MSAQTNDRPWSADIADNVAAETARRGMTGKSLGQQLGISVAGMSDRRRYRQAWSLDELDRASKVLGCPVEVLLGLAALPRLDSNQQPAGYPLRLVA